MNLNWFLIQVLIVMPVVARAAAEENGTLKVVSEQRDVKKLEIRKKMYGGKELKPPPKIVIVTHEIWLDLKISNYYNKGNHLRERVIVGCFGELLPTTTQNFLSLIRGYTKNDLYMSYRGTKVQKIINDFMIQLGDVKSRFSFNVKKIEVPKFQPEGFELSHSNAGWVGMANFGASSNSSQFYITLRSTKWLDGFQVLFAKVIKGMNVIQTIGMEETDEDDKPLRPVVIENCGVLSLKIPYSLTAEQFNTDGDINTGTQ